MAGTMGGGRGRVRTIAQINVTPLVDVVLVLLVILMVASTYIVAQTLKVQLPRAITTLRQGVGRLIRDENDRGLVVICDPRLRGKAYGRRVLASLPPMPVLDEVPAAQAWLREMQAA